jgi:hypothetical protein
MIDELVKSISEGTGLGADQARTVVAVVMAFLKGRLPVPLASSLESIVGGEAGTGSTAGGVGSMQSMHLHTLLGEQRQDVGAVRGIWSISARPR